MLLYKFNDYICVEKFSTYLIIHVNGEDEPYTDIIRTSAIYRIAVYDCQCDSHHDKPYYTMTLTFSEGLEIDIEHIEEDNIKPHIAFFKQFMNDNITTPPSPPTLKS